MSFQTAPSFPLVTESTSLAIADVNGDGRKDLLATTTQASAFSVLIATNSGWFMPVFANQAPGLVNGVSKIAAADFNSDGHADVLVLGTLLLHMNGNGTGAFTLVTNLNPVIPTSGVREGCAEFAIADFNGDNRPDIAATFGNSHMQLLKGNGDGTFAVSADVPVAPAKMFVGDYTGDGKRDLLYTVSIGSPGLLAGRGDGTFDPPVTLAATFSGATLASADFNGDGQLDMAGTDAANHRINLYLGSGGGSFQTAVQLSVRRFPTDLATGDLDGDGRSDLAVGSRDDGMVTVFHGAPAGLQVPPIHWSASWQVKHLLVGDVTADGIPDIVASNQTVPTKQINLFRGLGGRRFFAPASHTVGPDPLKGYTIESMAVADFDADGHRDVVVVNGLETTIFWGNGAGGFSSTNTLAAFPPGTGNPTSVALTDLNNDQRPDLGVTAVYSKLAIYTNSGSRNFAGPTLFATGPTTTSPAYVHFADVNLDLKMDAIILNRWGVGGVPSRASILGGLGNGQFNPAVEVDLSGLGEGGLMLTTANIAGAVRPEIFFPYISGFVQYFPDNNTNAWTQPGTWKQYATPAIHRLSSLELADFDRDGRLDYAFTDPTNNWVSVSRGLATVGQFATQIDYPVVGAPRWLRARDVNGDGMPDLVACNSQTNLVTVLTNNHAGGFGAAAYFRVSPFGRPLNLLVADMNHDFKPDIITANGAGNTLTVMLNDTDFGAPPVMTLTIVPPNAIVRWPASGGDFLLQYAGSLAPNILWTSPIRFAPVSGFYSFTNPAPTGTRFFRLQPVP